MPTREEILADLARRAPDVAPGEMGRYIRENPDEAVVAIPPPAIPGPSGVRPMVRPGLGVTPRAAPSGGPAPRFQPAEPRFTPLQPRFAPGTAATAPRTVAPGSAAGAPAPAAPPPVAPTAGVGFPRIPLQYALPAAAAGAVATERGLRTPPAPSYGDMGEMPSEETQRMLAARRMQNVDEQDAADYARMIAARRMQAVDDADREADARMIAARARQAIDDRDRARDRAPDPSQLVGSSGVAAAPSEPSGDGGSFLSKIFSGKDYQSAGGPMFVKRGDEKYLNWGDPESSADFFRASQAMARMSPEEQASLKGVSGRDVDYENRMAASKGKAEGGGVTGGKAPTKEAMLHKALEIIHHLIQK